MAERADPLRQRVLQHLEVIYPDHDRAPIAQALMAAMRLEPGALPPTAHTGPWTQSDVWTICYGDTVHAPDEPPLQTLRMFLRDRFEGVLNGVHVLPFCPYTSDHGFAVADYTTVDPKLGSWADIDALAAQGVVMGDLVVNHCSASHPWFKQFERGEQPGAGYFTTVAPDTDLSAVVRPRTSPLRRPTETPEGVQHVWCTFSHDQIDLNFANPEVLFEFAKIIRLNLDHGVTVFRLDAVAFIWKELGTDCINRPQTHELVRLMRTLTEHADPRTVIVTETNIPNRENLSYFGNGNEAHLVYNFSLPPLLLHALQAGDCTHLRSWLMRMPPAQPGTAYFNFLASHDGIGLRPAEGLLSDEELAATIATCERRGGKISYRTLPDGSQRPYEINIALFDALAETHAGPDAHQIERFVCAHAVMLALEGIPAFYLNSLLATPNDQARFERSGKNRSVNRKQWGLDEISTLLDDPQTPNAQVCARLSALVRIRAAQPAFHPNATQFTLHLGDNLFGFWRQSQDRRQSIFAIFNVTDQPVELPLADVNLVVTDDWMDLISGEHYSDATQTVSLAPYQVVWITNRRG